MRRILLLSLLIITHSLPAQTPSKQDKIHSFMTALFERGQFTGSILVAEHGKVIYKNAFGLADREHQRAFTTSTTEYIGSISKPFTAMGIMLLKERGQLTYDTPVRKIFPELPSCMDPVTINHLLRHTAGLAIFDDYPDMTDKDVFKILTDQKELRFTPGERFEYCNAGYSLLGMIIEKISGQSLNDFLTVNIFKPLKMNNTSVNHISNRNKERATGYTLYRTQNNYDTFMGGNASIISNIDDLFKWDQALYRPKFIQKETLDEAFVKSAITLDDNIYGPKSYGLGWWIAEHNGSPTYFHDGAFGGYRAYIERFPEQKNTIIHISNLRHTIMMDMRTALVNILDGKPYELPKISISVWMYKQIESGGVNKAIEHFHALTRSPEIKEYFMTESEFNSLGYFLIRANRMSDAIAIFKLNTEEYPNSGNTHDSLGEAYMKAGMKELAIASYKKSLELDPTNGNAVQMLKELEK